MERHISSSFPRASMSTSRAICLLTWARMRAATASARTCSTASISTGNFLVAAVSRRTIPSSIRTTRRTTRCCSPSSASSSMRSARAATRSPTLSRASTASRWTGSTSCPTISTAAGKPTVRPISRRRSTATPTAPQLQGGSVGADLQRRRRRQGPPQRGRADIEDRRRHSVFYGRVWTGVSAGPQGNGLYRKATKPAPGKHEEGIQDYRILKSAAGTLYEHPVAKTSYKFDGSTWWSYDSPNAVKLIQLGTRRRRLQRRIAESHERRSQMMRNG